MRIRTFLAIELDAAVKTAVRQIVNKLPLEPQLFRWVADEHLHLTIRFLGSVEESKISQIGRVLSEAVKKISQFELSFNDIGGFPHLKKCRILWAGVQKGAEECLQIRKVVDESLVPLGFALEPQTFVPHLTIGRAKNNRFVSCDFDQQAVRLNSCKQLVTHFNLFKSDLYPTGPVHTKLLSFPLLKNSTKLPN